MFKKIGIFLLAGVMLGGLLLGTGLVYAQETSGNYGLDETVGQIDAFKGGDPINPQTHSISGGTNYWLRSILCWHFVSWLSDLCWSNVDDCSRGRSPSTKAKDLLINAVIGLIIVFAAYP